MAHLIARGHYRKTVEIQMQLNPTKSNTDQHWNVSLIANQLWRKGKQITVLSKSPRCGLQYGSINATFSNSTAYCTGKNIRQVQGLELDASVVFIVYYYNNILIRGYCTTGLAGCLFPHTSSVSNRRLQTSNWRFILASRAGINAL